MNKRATTKEKILQILKKDYELSIKELVANFTISEIAVRKHLSELIRQGFIKERIVKQEIGRPYHLYALTKKGHQTFPNQYEKLPVELLKDLEVSQGEEAIHDLLLVRKEREEEELNTQLSDKDFDEKVKKMIDLLEEKGYMIEYIQTADGHYEIRNFNCPIYNLASSYHQVCKNEKDMYANIFPKSKVIAHSCMTKGANYCNWFISRPEA